MRGSRPYLTLVKPGIPQTGDIARLPGAFAPLFDVNQKKFECTPPAKCLGKVWLK